MKSITFPLRPRLFFLLHQNSMHRLLFFVACISLFASVTNFVPLSAVFCLFAALTPLFVTHYPKQDVLVLSLYSMMVYFALTVLWYAPLSFTEFQFYRRDGNVFITFAPLFVLAVIPLKNATEKITERFVLWSSAVLLCALVAIYIPQKHSEFFFLFYAHNAAGGFLAVTTALGIGLWMKKRSWGLLFSSSLLFLGLFLTNSRGSLLALLIALMFSVVFKERHNKKLLLMGTLVTLTIVGCGYEAWCRLPPEFRYTKSIDEAEKVLSVESERSHTIIDRVIYLWPQAIDMWFHSPLVGVGFGAYNDRPLHLEGTPGVYMVNHPRELVFSDGHAHHTFLHILAETGLIGLCLTLLFLYHTKKRIDLLSEEGLKKGLQIAFWVCFWSSMTEHRFFTPSQMFPFVLCLGLAISNEKSQLVLKAT